jgi:hypothetical protein
VRAGQASSNLNTEGINKLHRPTARRLTFNDSANRPYELPDWLVVIPICWIQKREAAMRMVGSLDSLTCKYGLTVRMLQYLDTLAQLLAV